MEIWHRFL